MLLQRKLFCLGLGVPFPALAGLSKAENPEGNLDHVMPGLLHQPGQTQTEHTPALTSLPSLREPAREDSQGRPPVSMLPAGEQP